MQATAKSTLPERYISSADRAYMPGTGTPIKRS